jgi:hypothetical protein
MLAKRKGVADEWRLASATELRNNYANSQQLCQPFTEAKLPQERTPNWVPILGMLSTSRAARLRSARHPGWASDHASKSFQFGAARIMSTDLSRPATVTGGPKALSFRTPRSLRDRSEQGRMSCCAPAAPRRGGLGRPHAKSGPLAIFSPRLGYVTRQPASAHFID